MQVLTRSEHHLSLRPVPGPSSTLGCLRALLDRAAELEWDDRSGWSQLRAEVAVTIDALIDDGHVPGHLGVTDDDPPVVVARLLVAAWRRSTVAPRLDQRLDQQT